MIQILCLVFLALNHKINMLLAISLPEYNFFYVLLCFCVGELYRDTVQVWWWWLSVILHCVLCWTRGHSLWKRQLLQVWSKFKPKYHGNHQNRLFYHLSLFFTLFRCFCKDCLNVLVGPGTFDKLKEVDPWSCYICLPSKCYGVLKLRPDWSVRVQEYFANNSAFEFVSVHLILLMLDI